MKIENLERASRINDELAKLNTNNALQAMPSQISPAYRRASARTLRPNSKA
jgi:hypothetical protein